MVYGVNLKNLKKVPEIEILQWNLKDIITTRGDGLIDVNVLPSLDDEGWFDEFK